MTEKGKKIGYAGSTIIEIVDWRTPDESNRVSLQRLRIELDP